MSYDEADGAEEGAHRFEHLGRRRGLGRRKFGESGEPPRTIWPAPPQATSSAMVLTRASRTASRAVRRSASPHETPTWSRPTRRSSVTAVVMDPGTGGDMTRAGNMSSSSADSGGRSSSLLIDAPAGAGRRDTPAMGADGRGRIGDGERSGEGLDGTGERDDERLEEAADPTRARGARNGQSRAGGAGRWGRGEST